MGKLAGLPETVSTHDVSREAQLEIASTRQSMQIVSKMLLGFTVPVILILYLLIRPTIDSFTNTVNAIRAKCHTGPMVPLNLPGCVGTILGMSEGIVYNTT